MVCVCVKISNLFNIELFKTDEKFTVCFLVCIKMSLLKF